MDPITARFNQAAPAYDDHATVQADIADDLAAFASDLKAPRSIIEHGCGTGLLTERLAELFPKAGVTAFDPSPAMILLAERRTPGRVAFRPASIETANPSKPADLVACASALHWCASIPDALRAMHGHTRRGGRLILAVMSRGTLGELHELRARLFPDLLPARQMPDPDDIFSACKMAGFRIDVDDLQDYTRTYADAATMLRSLHDQGLTSGPLCQGQRPLLRRELETLVSEYDRSHATPDGGVLATYRVFFLLGTAE